MIEIRIRWEASYWHDELPFVRPRSAFMGRKLVRENEWLRSGGLLSFPRTGCALCALAMLSREQKSRHHGHTGTHQPPHQPNVQQVLGLRPTQNSLQDSALSPGFRA